MIALQTLLHACMQGVWCCISSFESYHGLVTPDALADMHIVNQQSRGCYGIDHYSNTFWLIKALLLVNALPHIEVGFALNDT